MKFRYSFIVLLLVFFSPILRARSAAVQLPDGFVVYEEYSKTGEIKLKFFDKSKNELTREYVTNSTTGKNITSIYVNFGNNKIYVHYKIAFKGKNYDGIIQLTTQFKELLKEEYPEDEYRKVVRKDAIPTHYDVSAFQTFSPKYWATSGRFYFRVYGSYEGVVEHPKKPKYDVLVMKGSLANGISFSYKKEWNQILSEEPITDMEILYADSNRLLLLGRNVMSETVSEDILYFMNAANGEVLFKVNMNSLTTNGFAVGKGTYNPIDKRIYLAGTVFDKTLKKKKAVMESLSMLQLSEGGNLIKDEPLKLPELDAQRKSGATDNFGLIVNNLLPDGKNGFVMLVSHFRGELVGMSNLHYFLYGVSRYELNEKMEVKSIQFVLANRKEVQLEYMKFLFGTPDGKHLVFSNLDKESTVKYNNVPYLVSFIGNGEIKPLPETTPKSFISWEEGKNMFWSENNKTLYFLSSDENKLPINGYPLN